MGSQKPKFSRRACSSIWRAENSKAFKRDPDELKSAEILLKEASISGDEGNPYRVQPITLPQIDGFTALAFAMPGMVRKYGAKIRELSLDSACE